MSRPWRRRHPAAAGLIAGIIAFVIFGVTLQVLGGAEPDQAWSIRTALGAGVIWFVAWAVYSRDEDGASEETEQPGGS